MRRAYVLKATLGDIMHISRPAPDIAELTDAIAIPGLGFLPVNAYVVYAREPVLIDTGLRASSPDFLDELWSLVEPDDLRWVYLTHPDHTGSVFEILATAQDALLVTSRPGLGLLSLEHRVPRERMFVLNPGERLDVGDRRLMAFRPPLRDNPATTGLIDELTGACFGSDCFGAPMTSGDLVQSEDVAAVPDDERVAGERLWTAADTPRPADMDRDAYLSGLAWLRDLAPSVVLGGHLTPAHFRVETVFDTLADARDAPSHMGPDELRFRRTLAGMEPTRI
ncbi:MBL fold metallo-hydrolase [Actinomadura decatromicini]|uniref:MBL fold metallo-hydrolase n=2 Tax=Actinomadura decatromicini TaxID=2604572 RepID=A0A5D3F4F0_9ACTN|nr:MBL fold metallo-hydrolase [Actinomadura decatromicini]